APAVGVGTQDHGGGPLARRAYDLDSFVGGKLLPNFGLRQIGLPMEQAGDRAAVVGRNADHTLGVFVAARLQIGRGRHRANQHQSRQHKSYLSSARAEGRVPVAGDADSGSGAWLSVKARTGPVAPRCTPMGDSTSSAASDADFAYKLPSEV